MLLELNAIINGIIRINLPEIKGLLQINQLEIKIMNDSLDNHDDRLDNLQWALETRDARAGNNGICAYLINVQNRARIQNCHSERSSLIDDHETSISGHCSQILLVKLCSHAIQSNFLAIQKDKRFRFGQRTIRRRMLISFPALKISDHLLSSEEIFCLAAKQSLSQGFHSFSIADCSRSHLAADGPFTGLSTIAEPSLPSMQSVL
jgi:hypothetical protein